MEKRRLTDKEIEQLINDADDSETTHLRSFLIENGMTAAEFFNEYGIDHFGLIENGRPLYLAVLAQDEDKKTFWTIVNKGLKEFISFCKISKRELKKWFNLHGEMYAVMEKGKPESSKWVEWLGFHKIGEDGSIIHYCYLG